MSQPPPRLATIFEIIFSAFFFVYLFIYFLKQLFLRLTFLASSPISVSAFTVFAYYYSVQVDLIFWLGFFRWMGEQSSLESLMCVCVCKPSSLYNHYRHHHYLSPRCFICLHILYSHHHRRALVLPACRLVIKVFWPFTLLPSLCNV